MRYLALLMLLVSCGALATNEKTDNKFMPENNLNLEDSFVGANMTQDEFFKVISTTQEIYAPILSGFGLTLRIQGDWNDSTVNAYASRQGNTALVQMFGGLARRPEVTIDGFAMVVCHELGHHIAGFPFVSGWASAEGQSDLYALHVCARKVFDAIYNENPAKDEDAQAVDIVTQRCRAKYSTQDDVYMCMRSMYAGKSLANLLARLNGQTVSYTTPDRTIVRQTQTMHPRAQCRLDTYVVGALCEKYWDDNIIPTEEMQSSGYNCSRPRCWFAPRIIVRPDPRRP